MRRAVLAVLAALCTVGLGTPADATHPNGTHNTASGVKPRVGESHVVVNACVAQATPAAGWVVLATSVYCSVNSVTSLTVTTPGPVSAVTVANATPPPVQVCVTSQAIFVSPTAAIYLSPWNTTCYLP